MDTIARNVFIIVGVLMTVVFSEEIYACFQRNGDNLKATDDALREEMSYESIFCFRQKR